MAAGSGLFREKKRYSWREIQDSANALATALVQLGAKKGDRVAIQSKNSRAMFESMYAITRTGAMYVPISSYSSPFEACQMANICDAVLVIAEAAYAEHMHAVAKGYRSVRNIVLIGKPDGGASLDGVVAQDHGSLISKNLGTPTASVEVSDSDICWQNFTSGTTGTPKSDMNSHGGIHYALANVISTMFPDMSCRDSTLAAVSCPTNTCSARKMMAGAWSRKSWRSKEADLIEY